MRIDTCLRGGLDSSAVSAISNLNYIEAAGLNFTAIHARFIDRESDEGEFAEDVAKELDFDFHIVISSPEDFKILVDEVVFTQ